MFLLMDMPKKFITKEEAVAFFRHIIDDKNAIHECIVSGGNVNERIKERGIQFANPVQYRES